MKINLVKKNKMKIRFAASTHRGKIRKVNQDNVVIGENIILKDSFGAGKMCSEDFQNEHASIFGIFDGIGGLENGEIASYIAAEMVGKSNKSLWENEGKFLNQICKKANDNICLEIERTKDRMGTTVAILLVKNRRIWTCNIGDSPIYRYRAGKLEALYEEHSERKLRIELSGEESVKGKKFPLTQYLGIPNDVLELSPFITNEEIKCGDIFLLCSDGLTDMVFIDEIEEVLAKELDLKEKVYWLEEHALANGGKDNISIIIVKISN